MVSLKSGRDLIKRNIRERSLSIKIQRVKKVIQRSLRDRFSGVSAHLHPTEQVGLPSPPPKWITEVCV